MKRFSNVYILILIVVIIILGSNIVNALQSHTSSLNLEKKYIDLFVRMVDEETLNLRRIKDFDEFKEMRLKLINKYKWELLRIYRMNDMVK